MTKLNKQLMPIPIFESEDDERDFWATHDSTDYIDWGKAQRVTFPDLKPTPGLPQLKTVSISLPEPFIDDLKALAYKRDIPFDTLIKIFLTERVEQEKRG